MIEWAVIPVAGHGTRLQPAATVIPKTLLPVGSWPMLHWALDEAVRAGIRGIVLVIGPDQQLVRDYVDAAVEAGRHGEESDLGNLGRQLRDCDIHWIRQETPTGIGDAFVRCQALTRHDVFAVLLPDNWFDAPMAAIGQVAQAYFKTGLCSLGLTEVIPEEHSLFGNVGGVRLELLESGCFRVLALQDKLPGEFAAASSGVTLRGCARYVVDERFYEALHATGPPPDGEWDDVPAFQHLIAGPGLAAARIEGRHYDVGHLAGYLAAATYLGRRAAEVER